MSRIPLHLLLLTTASICQAQSGTITPAPAWQVGDRREVTVDRTVSVTRDSTNYEVTSHGRYLLTVVSMKKDGYVVGLRTLSTDRPEKEVELNERLTGKPDPVGRYLKSVAQDMYKPLDGLETRFHITPAGLVDGQVDAVQAMEKLRPVMAQAVKDMANETSAHLHRTPEALTPARIDFLTDSIYAVLTKAQAQALEHLMPVFGHAFPESGSLRSHVTIDHARTPLGEDLQNVPAMVETGLDLAGPKEITCRTITTFDPGSLPVAAADSASAQAKPAKSTLTEERTDGFDRSTGWPTASNSELEYRKTGMRVHVTTRTQFTVPVR